MPARRSGPCRLRCGVRCRGGRCDLDDVRAGIAAVLQALAGQLGRVDAHRSGRAAGGSCRRRARSPARAWARGATGTRTRPTPCRASVRAHGDGELRAARRGGDSGTGTGAGGRWRWWPRAAGSLRGRLRDQPADRVTLARHEGDHGGEHGDGHECRVQSVSAWRAVRRSRARGRAHGHAWGSAAPRFRPATTGSRRAVEAFAGCAVRSAAGGIGTVACFAPASCARGRFGCGRARDLLARLQRFGAEGLGTLLSSVHGGRRVRRRSLAHRSRQRPGGSGVPGTPRRRRRPCGSNRTRPSPDRGRGASSGRQHPRARPCRRSAPATPARADPPNSGTPRCCRDHGWSWRARTAPAWGLVPLLACRSAMRSVCHGAVACPASAAGHACRVATAARPPRHWTVGRWRAAARRGGRRRAARVRRPLLARLRGRMTRCGSARHGARVGRHVHRGRTHLARRRRIVFVAEPAGAQRMIGGAHVFGDTVPEPARPARRSASAASASMLPTSPSET